MKKLLPFFLLLIFTSSILATSQDADKIVYNGVEHDLYSNPLEDYYKADADRRPGFMIGPLSFSSANWRGYIANWEIAGGKLYLTKIDSWLCKGGTKESCHQVSLSELFPGKVSNSKVLADWFSGELRVPVGKLLQYVHMGYGSTFERDLIFKVNKGAASEAEIIDNTKRELPSESEAALKELQKLKDSPLGNKPAFGQAPQNSIKPLTKREPKSGLEIVPGQGVFTIGTGRSDLETLVGDGERESKYNDVYFVDYPKAGIQVSYENGKNTVHVIYLYNKLARYENFVIAKVKTDKGIDWNSSPEDILSAYGKPVHDYSNEGPVKYWRRLEYAGIDFLFDGGRLGRIGILPPEKN